MLISATPSPAAPGALLPAACPRPVERPLASCPRPIEYPLADAAPRAATAGAAGVAAATWPPLIDFPGLAAGQVFDLAKGTKVGPVSPKGTGTIQRWDPDHITMRVQAGRFGVNIDVVVDVVQIGADLVRISSTGSGIPDQVAEGRVVSRTTNAIEFERVGRSQERTRIVHDGSGNVVIDTVVPTLGAAHLVLDRR